ncbi:MAG: cadmium-translocating P-type ATPase, partial [Clostridia bacterium]|nr:cadmium-translocating P-type ATPase [Clostridia bacterium]
AEDLHLDHDHHHHHGIKSGMGKYGRLIGASVLFSVGLFVGFSGIYQVAIFIVAYLLIAQKVLVTAVKNVIKGQMFDENFLMAIASIVAFAIGEYAEGVAVMIFYALGQLAEDYAIDKSKGSISKLLDLKPDYATLKTEDGTRLVKPNEVSVGDIIMVKAGERIPLDGIVISGDSLVDTAMLTGESLPVHALVNTEVFSGTINLHGVLEVRVLKVFGESAVSKILKMVEKANENKAPTEKFITRFAKVYTPAVVFTAAAIALVPPLLLGQTFSTWLYRGAIFLVVSCPCALVISVPLGYFGGIGAAARKGVLIKGGEYLEGLKNAKTIVFDKTGTLTKGNFSIERIDAVSDVPEAALRKIAAHLEKFSNHPIAKAIVASYEGPIDEGAVSQVS